MISEFSPPAPIPAFCVVAAFLAAAAGYFLPRTRHAWGGPVRAFRRLSAPSVTYLDGTSLTNAYSCCRLLWRRDREGRTVLRSAQTGTDHLYHAMEDVWLGDVSTNGVEVLRTVATSLLGGPTTTRREWQGGGGLQTAEWTETTTLASFLPSGHRVETTVTASSDCGLVTNSVSTYDLLGRLVSTLRPGANGAAIATTYAYDGATSRILAFATTATGLSPRITAYLYDDYGEQVGSLLDGITNRTDTMYETDASNIVWRVTTSRIVGSSTNACSVIRERLTGLGDNCRSKTESFDLSGKWSRTLSSALSETGWMSTVRETSDAGTVTNILAFGLPVETSDPSGVLSYAYDSANRLTAVSSNGVGVASFAYDAKSRRIRKTTPAATHTYFYDDWNLVEERIARADGTAATNRYYWGKDLSGSLQGAGGVGGLLVVSIDDVPYFPCYDHNGNVTRYLDSSGATVAAYAYDAFGRTLSATGPLADAFPHRFSTKYFDPETGLLDNFYRSIAAKLEQNSFWTTAYVEKGDQNNDQRWFVLRKNGGARNQIDIHDIGFWLNQAESVEVLGGSFEYRVDCKTGYIALRNSKCKFIWHDTIDSRPAQSDPYFFRNAEKATKWVEQIVRSPFKVDIFWGDSRKNER